MMIDYQVGEYYTIKEDHDSVYDFPDGEYKLKIIMEGFPEKAIYTEDEIAIAEELWLEGFEGLKQYKIDLEGNWYYFEFPENENKVEYMWIPESIVIDVFE